MGLCCRYTLLTAHRIKGTHTRTSYGGFYIRGRDTKGARAEAARAPSRRPGTSQTTTRTCITAVTTQTINIGNANYRQFDQSLLIL